MDKLKKLFESLMLTEEVQSSLVGAFQEVVDSKVSDIKEQLETEYQAKLVTEQEDIFNSVNEIVKETIEEEMSVLSEEIKSARTLEVRYAEKLELFKEEYHEKVSSVLPDLISDIVEQEVDELREGIEEAKKHQFTMKMFESFKDVYENMFGSSDIDLKSKLNEAQEELDTLRKETKINSLLENIKGDKRKVMLTILEDVSYENLDAKFESIKPIILAETVKESVDKNPEVKGDIVLEESLDIDDKQSAADANPMYAKLLKSIQFAKTR